MVLVSAKSREIVVNWGELDTFSGYVGFGPTDTW